MTNRLSSSSPSRSCSSPSCGTAVVVVVVMVESDTTSAWEVVVVEEDSGGERNSANLSDKSKSTAATEGGVVDVVAVSYTHLRAHETPEHLVCRLLLEKKKKINGQTAVKTVY
eukprot:TRINITY_DN36550_c0_g1_i2.p2 TRINITY_DN36550_c0_g1~~TRINITY_DN36550_c0_g1_i2.p2  ORF type:complete len:113 (-),score=24.28 TRINITY_DN36550_c0_g1_i2:49-387(-)